MSESKNKSYVHGYKVFNSDWTCTVNGNTKQYTCPGKFEEDVELEIGSRGMHFCQTAADCFNYYDFDSNNKVAEVIAYGEVLTDDDKSCTDKLEIVREILWDEVLQIAKLEKSCTGLCNTGDGNTGDRNTGNRNAGDYNTGDENTGNRNTGNGNNGDWNTGVLNAGDYNAGDCNIGNRNTGNRNNGDWNTGDWNIGNKNTGRVNTGNGNTGNRNIGNSNTGNGNIGSRNTGDYNKSSFNTGCFNTVEQKIMLFNKPSDMSYLDWCKSDARRLLDQMLIDAVEWIYEKDMTAEEKEQHPEYKTTNGYLKVLNESECGQLWWDNLSAHEKEIIKSIPNFDADIFKECTGIDVNKQQVVSDNGLSSIKSF